MRLNYNRIQLYKNLPNPDEKMILAHWTYSREEWIHFLRWNSLQKGIVPFVWNRLTRPDPKIIPEVVITPIEIWTGRKNLAFNNSSNRFMHVDIRDTGSFNVLEISCERTKQHRTTTHEIKIPVPKGKLKEAMQLQDRLQKMIL
jgi:hypothetical protein